MFRTWIFLKEVVQLGKTERKKKKKNPLVITPLLLLQREYLLKGGKKKTRFLADYNYSHLC